MNERALVLYSGRVQGVGFRMTAVSIASRFRVSGYVRNLPDGDVELSAEGEKDEVGRFLAAVKSSHLGRFITHSQVAWGAASGEHRGFGIRYD